MEAKPPPFWRLQSGGVAVAIRVQPRARRAGLGAAVLDAAGAPRLRIAVTEPPEDGRATRAACAALASALGLPTRDVTVLHGAGSREKLLLAAGNADVLAARLRALAGSTGATRAAVDPGPASGCNGFPDDTLRCL
jgi:uncharacterized protein YggU (UPF0235/DUF167 family)